MSVTALDPTFTPSKSAAYTSQQTGAAFWTPKTGQRVVVTGFDLQFGGTTAGTVRLWWGASGDTTYSAGTDAELTYFDGSTPSATLAPGKVVAFSVPVAGPVDYILRVTTSAAVTVEVIVHGYEISAV